ncbi:hypothetical protein [Nocardia aurantia]|uniref:hypothetical protein n=1 Tax=Nocardia aurantia TaxID=2585199 RepID=UPI001295F6FD|nr:hypothetical protein [Nocardia aurantia]
MSWGRAEVGSAEKPRAAVHRVLTAGATLDTAPFEPLLTPDLVGSEIARLYQTPDMWDERRVYQLESNGLHAPA